MQFSVGLKSHLLLYQLKSILIEDCREEIPLPTVRPSSSQPNTSSSVCWRRWMDAILLFGIIPSTSDSWSVMPFPVRACSCFDFLGQMLNHKKKHGRSIFPSTDFKALDRGQKERETNRWLPKIVFFLKSSLQRRIKILQQDSYCLLLSKLFPLIVNTLGCQLPDTLEIRPQSPDKLCLIQPFFIGLTAVGR